MDSPTTFVRKVVFFYPDFLFYGLQRHYAGPVIANQNITNRFN